MKIEKIIYENREELFDAANKCDERLESKAAGLMRTALDETPDGKWINVDDRLPEIGVKVGVKRISDTYRQEDWLVESEMYKPDGSRARFVKWYYAKNMHVQAWTPLPNIEKLINPVKAILDLCDKNQSSKTTEEDAAPFHDKYWEDDGMVHQVRSPDRIIEAIKDACNEMSYSNYHNAHFDMAIGVIVSYCKEHNVPMDYREAAPTSDDQKKALRERVTELEEENEVLKDLVNPHTKEQEHDR